MASIKHSESFEIAQPVEALFPLFSPAGEKLWVPDWDYESFSEGTALREDYVFATKSHDHVASEAIWIVKKYEPEKHSVQFYKIEPREKVGIVQVECCEIEEAKSVVRVSYEYIGLSESGNSFVEGFSSSGYREFIAEWKQLLEKHFDKQTY